MPENRALQARWSLCVAAICSCVIAPVAGCNDVSEARPTATRCPNVILICMDTVRADRLGCYGYDRRPTTPHLDELAGQSIVFLDASATEGWTKPSVASFLTGTYPAQHGVYTGSARRVAGRTTDLLPEDSVTLAEVFEEQRYRTAAFVHNEHLSKGNGFEQGFHAYMDRLGDARDIRWRAVDWLDTQAGDGPFFLYLHFLDAHYPYPVPEEYATMFAGDGDVSLYRSGDWRGLRDAINSGDRVLSDAELKTLGALYDGSIRYIDDQLGRLFQSLKLRGLWDNTVICVVSDHGEEFMEHGRIGHGHGLYENLLRVPWILRVPELKSRKMTAQVSLVDLFPTLLAAVGLEPRATAAGVNRLARPGTALPIFAEHKERMAYGQSYRTGRHKLLRRCSRARREQTPPRLAELTGSSARWQVKFRPEPGGKLRATTFKPRSDSPSIPIQIKGMVQSPGESTFRLGGIAVHHSGATDYHGAVVEGQSGAVMLREGAPVKAEGSFKDGVLVAQRIKFYSPERALVPTIRGTIAEVGGTATDGRIRIGEVWIEVNRKTDWLVPDLDLGEDEMRREEVALLLKSGLGDGLPAGYRVSLRLFDLAEDPQENHGLETAPSRAPTGEDLDGFVGRLFDRRTFSADDQAVLTAEAVRKLRAIGYVD